MPGVEFSVCFKEGDIESVIHIVGIFNDEDDLKVKAIQNVLENNPPNYKQAYKEEDFLGLLRLIDLNTILIAHQKNTLTSQKVRKNDANSLGNHKFLEFVFTDYFEAFEFKNKRNEVINKSFLIARNLDTEVKFVTGTDCHDWSVYPSETPSEKIDVFPYTYAKCLPTFKGLVMAVTDHTRLKSVDSFFAVTKSTLDKIQLTIQNKNVEIPLSKGINVIIGDNSIGKSLFLHAISGYKKSGQSLQSTVSKGYKSYLQKNNIVIKQQLTPDQVFCFDMQGEIRAKFEENKLKASEFLGPFFPEAVSNSTYRSMLVMEIDRMVSYLEQKFDQDKRLKKLPTFKIDISEEKSDSLTFVNNIHTGKKKSEPFLKISEHIQDLITRLSAFSGMPIDEEDKRYFTEISNELTNIKHKYDNRIVEIELENDRMETISTIIKKHSDRHKRNISDAQKKKSGFMESSSEVKIQISEIIRTERSLTCYYPYVPQTKIRVNSNHVYDYEFISKLQIDEINTEYFQSVLSKVIRSGATIDWSSITEDHLKEILLRYDNTPVLDFLKNGMMEIIDADLLPKNSIIYKGMDRYEEMSSGFDAKVYFDLLSYETHQDGIYIIDQPEDNISQSAIRDYLLDRFKTMGENRQIIMVTHNPQFIVNLDIDNLIYLSKDKDTVKVQSGALEYVCQEYSVLDVVAQNIDGGLNSIRKRWKRYEKTASL